jgi:hypothetical protein
MDVLPVHVPGERAAKAQVVGASLSLSNNLLVRSGVVRAIGMAVRSFRRIEHDVHIRIVKGGANRLGNSRGRGRLARLRWNHSTSGARSTSLWAVTA